MLEEGPQGKEVARAVCRQSKSLLGSFLGCIHGRLRPRNKCGANRPKRPPKGDWTRALYEGRNPSNDKLMIEQSTLNNVALLIGAQDREP